MSPTQGDSPVSAKAARIMWVLWPSFLIAAGATGVFFSLFDPQEFWLFGEHLEISRQGAYTIGFFGFWVVGMAASALTLWLASAPSSDGVA